VGRWSTPTGSTSPPYLHLHTSEELARVNAERVFRAMEFE
jgi:hypothetical protein